MPASFEYNNLTITWLHHASFLIQAGGTNLYIDPYKVNEGPKADIVLITHDHFDHFDEESVIALSHDSTKVVASASVKKTNVIDVALEPNALAKFDDWLIQCVPAYNIGTSFHQKEAGNCGFLIEYSGHSGGGRSGRESAGVTVYHAGDTDWIPEMSSLHGKVHIALLPIGGTYTMNVDDAIKATATIHPIITIPMHYNFVDGTTVTEERLHYFVGEAGKHCDQVVVLEPKIS